MKKLILIFLLFTGIGFTQPLSDAEFFGIDAKVSLQDTMVWVRINDIVSIDLVDKTVSWNVGLYDADFNRVLGKDLFLDFPSQALPLKNLK